MTDSKMHPNTSVDLSSTEVWGATTPWRGTLDDLRETAQSEFLRVPVFYVDHGTYGKWFLERQGVLRTKAVGEHLAKFLRGNYFPESRGHNFHSGSQEHIDGYVPYFLQLHTARYLRGDSQPAERKDATRFIINRYRLPDGKTVRSFIPETPGQKLAQEYNNSVPITTFLRPNVIDASFGRAMNAAGYSLPKSSGVLTVDVPIGCTAVFLNGFGDGNEIYSHQAMSVGGDGKVKSFQRVVSLGRVVVPGGVTI